MWEGLVQQVLHNAIHSIIITYSKVQLLDRFQIELFAFDFDPMFINEDGIFDFHYFSNIFKSVHNKGYSFLSICNVSIQLPQFLTLKFEHKNNKLFDYQKEQEAILFFQYEFFIQIEKYEYFFDRNKNKTLAVKKEVVESMKNFLKSVLLQSELILKIMDSENE